MDNNVKSFFDRLSDGEFESKKIYKDNPKEWKEDSYRLERIIFKEALFIELDIVNNPKREKLFEIAWDKGHSTGLIDVYYEAEELIKLIK